MTALFLDTSFVIALLSEDDGSHLTAAAEWRRQTRARSKIMVTEYIVLETVNFLISRNQRAQAIDAGVLLRNEDVDYVSVDDTLFDDGWRYLIRYKDKHFSLTDCVSFVVMKRRGISQALTFDHHFAQAGFEILPKVKG